jgi:hypothetical protein
MVLGSFTDLATTSDRKWALNNIANNVNSMCGDNQDGVLPEDSNFTRDLIKAKKIERTRANPKELLRFVDEDDNALFEIQLQEKTGGTCGGPGGGSNCQAGSYDCDIGLNASSSLDHSSGSLPEVVSDINNERRVMIRLFSGSSSENHDVTIQIKQE